MERSLVWIKLHLHSNTFLFFFIILISKRRHKFIFVFLPSSGEKRRFTSIAALLNGPTDHNPINVIWKTNGSDCIRQYVSKKHLWRLERMKYSAEAEVLFR